MAFRLKKYLINVKDKLALDDPIIIKPYIGYASDKFIYCKGRVLENEGEEIKANDSIWKNFINSLKRIESDEIPNTPITFTFRENTYRAKTDSEGFFTFERKWEEKVPRKASFLPYQTKVLGKNLPGSSPNKDLIHEGEILFPSKSSKIGVISDIDDTLLKTDVLSNFKWRAMYNTMFIKAKDRMPIHFVNNWYQKLAEGKGGEANPFFYISHSPWNLYDYLQMFLAFHKFPKGPVFLRDFGIKTKEAKYTYYHHKRIEIERILTTFPNKQFVLVGDGAERDAKIYLKIHNDFPGRVKAIFIREIGNSRNRKKLRSLEEKNPGLFFLIKTGREGMKHSRALGLID